MDRPDRPLSPEGASLGLEPKVEATIDETISIEPAGSPKIRASIDLDTSEAQRRTEALRTYASELRTHVTNSIKAGTVAGASAIPGILQNSSSDSLVNNLLKAVGAGRASSGDAGLRRYVNAAKSKNNTFTYDVENEFFGDKDPRKGRTVSVAYSDSSTGQRGSVVRSDYKAILEENAKYHETQGNQTNAEFVRNLAKSIKRSIDKGTATVVDSGHFADEVAKKFESASPNAQLQNWYGKGTSSDDAKLSDVFSSLSKKRAAALNGKLKSSVDLSTAFRSLFGFTSPNVPGTSLSAAADLMGMHPKKFEAHESLQDTVLTEQLGKILNDVTDFQTAKRAGSAVKVPTSYLRMAERLQSSPEHRNAWNERVFAEAVARDMQAIEVGKADFVDEADPDAIRARVVQRLTSFETHEHPTGVQPKGSMKENYHSDNMPGTNGRPTGLPVGMEPFLAGDEQHRTSSSEIPPAPVTTTAERIEGSIRESKIGAEGSLPLHQDSFTRLAHAYSLQFVENMRQAGKRFGGQLPYTAKGDSPSVNSVLRDTVEGMSEDLKRGITHVSGMDLAPDAFNEVLPGLTAGDVVENQLSRLRQLSFKPDAEGPNKIRLSDTPTLEVMRSMFAGHAMAAPGGRERVITSEDRVRLAPEQLQRLEVDLASERARTEVASSSQAVMNRLFRGKPEEAVLSLDLRKVGLSSAAITAPQTKAEFEAKYGTTEKFGIKSVMARLMDAGAEVVEANNAKKPKPQSADNVSYQADLSNYVASQERAAAAVREVQKQADAASRPVVGGGFVGFPRKTDNLSDRTRIVAMHENIERGLAYERGPAQQFLEEQGFTLLKSKKGTTEHEGTIGKVPGHPDILATRPEMVEGQWKRMLYAFDAKSPETPLPPDITMSGLLEKGKNTAHHVGQVMGYGAMTPESIRKYLRVGIVHEGEAGKSAWTAAPFESLAEKPVVKFALEGLEKIAGAKSGKLNIEKGLEKRIGETIDLSADTPESRYVKESDKINANAAKNAFATLISKHRGFLDLSPQLVLREQPSDLEKILQSTDVRQGLFRGASDEHVNKQTAAWLSQAKTVYAGLKETAEKKKSKTGTSVNYEGLAKNAVLSAIESPETAYADTVDSIASELEASERATRAAAADRQARRERGSARFNESRSRISGNLFRGASASDFSGQPGNEGPHKVEWFTEAGPSEGSQSEDEARQRARQRADYERRRIGALTRTQRLVHQVEAKRTLNEGKGEGDQDKFLKDVPAHTDASYEESLAKGISEAAYYEAEVKALDEKKTGFDRMLEVNDQIARKDKAALNKLLTHAKTLETAMARSTGIDKGFAQADFDTTIASLKNSGIRIEDFGFARPTEPRMTPDIALGHRARQTPYDMELAAGYRARKAQTATADVDLFVTEDVLHATRYDTGASDVESIRKARAKAQRTWNVNQEELELVQAAELPGPEKASRMKDLTAKQQTGTIHMTALDRYLAKTAGIETETPDFATPEGRATTTSAAVENFAALQQEAVKKAVASMAVAQSSTGLTPGLLKELMGHRNVLSSHFGLNPGDYGLGMSDISKLAPERFDELMSRESPSLARFKAVGNLETNVHALPTVARMDVMSERNQLAGKEVEQLYQKMGELNGTDLQKVTSQFFELAQAVETDIAKLTELEQVKRNLKSGERMSSDDALMHTELLSRLPEKLAQLGAHKQDLDKELMNYDIAAPEHEGDRDAYAAQAHNEIVSKRLGLMRSGSKLGASLGLEFNPELFQAALRTNRQMSDWGMEPGKVGLSLQDVMSKSGVTGVDSLVKLFGVKEQSSSNVQKFQSATQILTSSGTGSATETSTLSAMLSKGQSVKKVMAELNTEMRLIDDVSLSKPEGQFIKLANEIKTGRAAVQALNEAIRQVEMSGGVAPGEKFAARDTAIADLRAKHEQAKELQSKVSTQSMWQPGMWTEEVANAGINREASQQELIAKSIQANARIHAADRGRTATYDEFKEADALAKQVTQRGIDRSAYGGSLWTSEQIKQTANQAGRPFFKGAEHVSFTEQLVDLSKWQMQWAGASILTGAAKGATFGAIGETKNWEAQMKNVQLIAEASGVQMEQLQNKVFGLTQAFKVSPKELSEGLVILGQAGYKAGESLQIIGPIAMLATATLSSLKTSADITTTVLMAFGAPVAAAAEVTNSLAAATIESKLELESLGTVLNYVASTAHMAGLSLEDAETAMGLMSNAGVKSSTIGTSLRSILGAFIAPTSRFKEELGRVGMSADDVNPKLHSFGQIIQTMSGRGFNVENAFEGLDKRVAGNITTLMNMSGQFDAFKARITGTDRASAMAEGQMDTFEGQSQRLSNTLTTLKVSFWSGILEPAKAATEALADATGWAERLARITPSGVKGMMGAAAGVGATLGAGNMLLGAAGIVLPPMLSGALSGMKVNTEAPSNRFIGWLAKKAEAPTEPVRNKIFTSVSSMVAPFFNPWVLAGTALGVGGYYGIKAYREDKAGVPELKAAQRSSELRSSLEENLEAAAKYDNAHALGMTARPEVINARNVLARTGMFESVDARTGKTVNVDEYMRHHETYDIRPKDTGVRAQDALDAVRMYSRTQDLDRLKRGMYTGARQFATTEEVRSEEGKNAVGARTDELMSVIRTRGIAFNPQKIEALFGEINKETANTDFGGAVHQAISQRLAEMAESSDAPRMHAATARAAFLETAGRAEALGSALGAPSDKRSQTYFQAEGMSVLQDVIKSNKLNVDSKFLDKAQAKLAAGVRPEQIFDELQKDLTATRPRGWEAAVKKLTTAKAAYTPEHLTELMAQSKAAYGEMVSVPGYKPETTEEYGAAKVRFAESHMSEIQDYKDELVNLTEAQKKLSEMKVSDPGYAGQQQLVQLYKSRLDETTKSIKQLGEESRKLGIMGVATEYTQPVYKTARAVFGLSGLSEKAFLAGNADDGRNGAMSVSSVNFGAWAEKTIALQTKYQGLSASALNHENPENVKKLKVAYELELEDDFEAFQTQVFKRAKDHSDEIVKTIAQGLKLDLGTIDLKADMSKVKLEMAQSEDIGQMVQAPRIIVKGGAYKNTQMSDIKLSNVFDILGVSKEAIETRKTETAIAQLEVGHRQTTANYDAGVKAAEATHAQNKQRILDQYPASQQAPQALRELTAEESRYQSERIELGTKAFKSVEAQLQAEMRLREQLNDKIRSNAETAQEISKSLEQSMTNLAKAMGRDVRKDPAEQLQQAEKIRNVVREASTKGDLEQVGKGTKRLEEFSQEFASGEYSNKDREELLRIMKDTQGYVAKAKEVSDRHTQEQKSALDESSAKNKTILTQHYDETLQRQVTAGVITKEQATEASGRYKESVYAVSPDLEANRKILDGASKDAALLRPIGQATTAAESMTEMGDNLGELNGDTLNLSKGFKELLASLQPLLKLVPGYKTPEETEKVNAERQKAVKELVGADFYEKEGFGQGKLKNLPLVTSKSTLPHEASGEYDEGVVTIAEHRRENGPALTAEEKSQTARHELAHYKIRAVGWDRGFVGTPIERKVEEELTAAQMAGEAKREDWGDLYDKDLTKNKLKPEGLKLLMSSKAGIKYADTYAQDQSATAYKLALQSNEFTLVDEFNSAREASGGKAHRSLDKYIGLRQEDHQELAENEENKRRQAKAIMRFLPFGGSTRAVGETVMLGETALKVALRARLASRLASRGATVAEQAVPEGVSVAEAEVAAQQAATIDTAESTAQGANGFERWIYGHTRPSVQKVLTKVFPILRPHSKLTGAALAIAAAEGHFIKDTTLAPDIDKLNMEAQTKKVPLTVAPVAPEQKAAEAAVTAQVAVSDAAQVAASNETVTIEEFYRQNPNWIGHRENGENVLANYEINRKNAYEDRLAAGYDTTNAAGEGVHIEAGIHRPIYEPNVPEQDYQIDNRGTASVIYGSRRDPFTVPGKNFGKASVTASGVPVASLDETGKIATSGAPMYDLNGQAAPAGKLAQLTDQANVQSAFIDKFVTSADLLKKALDDLTTSINKSGTSTASGASAGVSVQVSAPVSMAVMTNGAGIDESTLESKIDQVCKDFFANDFMTRLQQSLATGKF